MLLSERLRITPFLKILPCFAAGIFAFGYVTAPDWVIVSATITCYLLAWALRKSVWGGCYSAAALFMCGILVTAIAATREVMPRGVRLAMVLEVNDTPVTQGRWQRTTADVGSFRRTDVAAGTWTPTDERIELRVDTSMRVAVGDQLCVTGYLNPLDTTGSRYGKLMRSRGISARTYVVEDGIVARLEGNGRRLIRAASTLHQAAVERIAQLNIDDADKDMVSALVAGEKRAFDPRLKEEYSRTGVAHILAVSGLHMGFVLIIANMLFGWLVLFRRGHILKNVLVILALWLYAVMAGLSPSVVRAALMCSGAQLAFACSVVGGGYNIVLGAATLMLAIRPFYLYDVSFQLSFAAVLSILFFYPRMYRRRLSRNKLLDVLWSSLLLGVAAQIGTLPIVLYNFGNLPLMSLLINPVVIFTAFVCILLGLVWLILPFPWLNGVCSTLIEWVLRIQNGTVSWAASTPVAGIGKIHVDGYWIALFYLLLGLVVLGWKLYEERIGGLPKNRLSYDVGRG